MVTEKKDNTKQLNENKDGSTTKDEKNSKNVKQINENEDLVIFFNVFFSF
jgi:hypothetical protein